MAELSGAGRAATAVVGARAQFDVVADGVTVFSKRLAGRFPEPGEIGRLLAG